MWLRQQALTYATTRLFRFSICHLQSHKLQFVDHFLGQISPCSDSLTLHRLFILLPCLRRSSSAPMERTDNWRVVVIAGICQARPRKLSKLACISLQCFRSRCTFSTATSRHSLPILCPHLIPLHQAAFSITRRGQLVETFGEVGISIRRQDC